MYMHARTHSQRWLIARWWKIMCDLTDWWICFCFRHPSMNRDICNGANTCTHTHTRTHTIIHTSMPRDISDKWLIGSGDSLCARRTRRKWSIFSKVKKSTQQGRVCVCVCVYAHLHRSMWACAVVSARVCMCLCVCVSVCVWEGVNPW